MKKNNTRKLALAAVFTAVAVVGSLFSFPVFGSKCAPVQHIVNILCAVFLGPVWGVCVAFAASLLRNLLGLGSLMAFPGSMIGALLCGLAYMAMNGRPLRLPHRHPVHGSRRRKRGILCLHHPVSDFHYRRQHHCRSRDCCAAVRRNPQQNAGDTGGLTPEKGASHVF